MEDSEHAKEAKAGEPGTAGESGEANGSRERARKERVLHTRISEQLAEDIRRVADDLRVPVSNLVRNVLEETFSVVESVTENLGTWLEDVATEVGKGPGPRHKRSRWARPFPRENEEEASSRCREEAAWENSWEASSSSPEKPLEGGPPGPSLPREEKTSEKRAQEGGASPQRGRPEYPEVLGWQPLVMNRPQACAGCGRLLVQGDRAHLGLTQKGVSGLVLCDACMDGGE